MRTPAFADLRGMRAIGAVVLVALLAACAPKTIPAPVVTTPKYPDFIAPTVPAELASSPAGVSQDRGWRFLQVGDLHGAQREFEAALRESPGFAPAETGLGYVALAGKDPKSALPHFDRALEAQHDSVAALVGRGEALDALARSADALTAFEAALAVDPSLAAVRRRVEVLRFRSLESDLSRARQAARAGQLDDAEAAYGRALAASPDSPFLYRELAGVERRRGEDDRALEHLRRAAALDPTDAASQAQIGELLEARDDLAGAEQAYASALAIEPDGQVERKLLEVRDRMALARLPEQYRAIAGAPQVTRADLAALVGVRLAALLQGSRGSDAVLITDVRGNWATPWILTVARAGIMEPFANHTFQPRAVVRRIDLAQVVSRLLARIAAARPGEPTPWTSARLKFSDVPAANLAYSAVSEAVASGAMSTVDDNAFQPTRPVTGAEATAAIERLEALAPERQRGAAAR